MWGGFMEYIHYIVIGLIISFIIKSILPTKGMQNISTAELKNKLKDRNKQFIDVRTSREYKGNHIKGFQNIPLDQLAQRANNLSKEKEVIVIYQSGMRSKSASKTLKKLGFTKVINVKGGMNAWS